MSYSKPPPTTNRSSKDDEIEETDIICRSTPY